MLKEIIAVFGFSTAITPLIAETDGMKDIFQGRNIFIHGLFLCIFLGIFLSYFIKNNNTESTFFIFLTVGVCGGFTTFSSFSNESLQLIQNGQIITFLTYLLLSFATGLLGVYLGTLTYKLL